MLLYVHMKRIAFWQHDKFPFVKSGIVLNSLPDGRVEVEQYGIGYVFTPILIVSEERGKVIVEELNTLLKEYNEGTNTFYLKMKRKLKRKVSPILLKHITF